MAYFDTEITIPVRVHYSADPGYEQTWDEPGCPAEAEIESLQIEESFMHQPKTGTEIRKYTYHPVPPKLAEVIIEICNEELEDEALDAAMQDEQDAYEEAEEAKFERAKDKRKYGY